jgi:4-hydroxy-tetrahydrodipicolinate synthase
MGSEKKSTLTGCGTALVTPFRQDFSLDEARLHRLVARQIEAGIDFLAPCGTTGENPTLTHEEHLRVVEISIAEARGRVPVLAGAGGYNTKEIVALARALESLHADGILSVAPYYSKPTQEGLYRHYKAIAEAVSVPVILYNVPRRTGVNIEPETVKRLAEIENILGIKEASGDISQMASLISRVPESFLILSGDDSIALPLIALGGHGLISVTSNEIPAEMTHLVRCALQNNFHEARRLQRKYLPLMEVNFIETNPLPVKTAMAAMGLLEPVWRLPLCPPKQETVEKVKSVLQCLELLGAEHAARAN